MIPKRLHQIWIGPRPLPAAIESWRDRHPDWEHYLWTDESIPFPLLNQAQYEASRTYSGKSNVIRFEMLYRYGGVYVDADTGCLQPLDEGMLADDFFCVYEDEQSLAGRIGTTYFGCSERHPIMRSMIDSIGREPAEKIATTPSWKITGPLRFTEVIDQAGGVNPYPSFLFFPWHHSGNRCTDEQFERAYAVHLWDTTYDEMGGYPRELMDHADLFGFVPASMEKMERPVEWRPVRERVYTRSHDVELQRDGDRLALKTRRNPVAVNASSAVIFGLCDGARTVGEVVTLLAQQFPQHARTLHWDVPLTILRLQHHGALTVAH